MATDRKFIMIDGIMVCREIDDIDREAERLGKYIPNHTTKRTRQAIDVNQVEFNKLFK